MSKVILLVDDDDAFRESVNLNLELENYVVIAVADGHSALNVLQDKAIGLVLTDILMPAMTGGELVQAIKKVDTTIKVIGMTGGGRTQKEASFNSFDGFLYKPFTRSELIEQIESQLN